MDPTQAAGRCAVPAELDGLRRDAAAVPRRTGGDGQAGAAGAPAPPPRRAPGEGDPSSEMAGEGGDQLDHEVVEAAGDGSEPAGPAALPTDQAASCGTAIGAVRAATRGGGRLGATTSSWSFRPPGVGWAGSVMARTSGLQVRSRPRAGSCAPGVATGAAPCGPAAERHLNGPTGDATRAPRGACRVLAAWVEGVDMVVFRQGRPRRRGQTAGERSEGTSTLQLPDLERALAAVDAATPLAAPGGGPPPLSRAFLHGFAGAPEAFAELTALLSALAPADVPAAQAHCPPLPGHNSPLPPPPGGWVQAVAAVAASLPPGPLHLVGYSLGARLALGVALAHPGRVRLLSLVGVNPGLETDDARAARRRSDLAWQRKLQRDGSTAFFHAWTAQPLFASQARLPQPVRAAQAAQRAALQREPLAAILGRTGLAAMPNYWPRLARLQVPTLLVAGSLDGKFVTLHRRMGRALPHATVAEVPEVGHNVVLEAPQALARLLWTHEDRWLGPHHP